MSANFSLLSPADYVIDATNHIKHAKAHISLFTMVIGSDESTIGILEALGDAASRGVNVEVAADIYSYYEHGGATFSKYSRQTTKTIKKLIKQGVKFNWLGQSHTTIFNGRTHIKWCIVDDIVYSFGGVNLYGGGISSNDFMIKLVDMKLADRLFNESKRLITSSASSYAYRSHSFITNRGEVLIDGGFIGESIIYRRVCQLAARANKVTLVSQYCPTGKLSRLLKKTDSLLYFNPPESTKGINKFFIKASLLLSGNSSLYKRTKYLHAKFMIFEMKNGQKIAVTGSHNFAVTGVALGTHEIALQTKDPLIIKELEDFVAQSVA